MGATSFPTQQSVNDLITKRRTSQQGRPNLDSLSSSNQDPETSRSMTTTGQQSNPIRVISFSIM